MSKEFRGSFGLKHPPSNLDMGGLSMMDAFNCDLFGTKWFEEFRSKFGHLVLVLQELEQELASTMEFMRRAYEQEGIAWGYDVMPKSATFETLIRMFADQLTGCDGSRDLVRHLHEARKYRNRLAHQFTGADSLENHLSAGGRAKTIHQLDSRIQKVVPLVGIICRIGRAYASDVGITDEYVAGVVEQWKEAHGLDEDAGDSFITGESRDTDDNGRENDADEE